MKELSLDALPEGAQPARPRILPRLVLLVLLVEPLLPMAALVLVREVLLLVRLIGLNSRLLAQTLMLVLPRLHGFLQKSFVLPLYLLEKPYFFLGIQSRF